MKLQAFLLLLALTGGMGAILLSNEAKSQERNAHVLSERVQSLLVERRDTFRALHEMVSSQFLQGSATLEDMVRAHDALLTAELELAATAEERLALHEQRVENFRHLERMVARQADAATSPPTAVLEVRAARLAAEIELELAKNGGA